MSAMSSEEIRAAAETYSELGPGYRDAVIESFLEKVGGEIDARVAARLAALEPMPGPTRRHKTLRRKTRPRPFRLTPHRRRPMRPGLAPSGAPRWRNW